jgi:phospholipase/carboxylesterase
VVVRRRSPLALVLMLAVLAGCGRQVGPEVTRIGARPAPPHLTVEPGARPLDLGTAWYRGKRRDGTLLVPTAARSGRPLPLLVLLHGGGGQADDFQFTLPLGEEMGVAVLLLDARHNTWDGVDSPFGPDVVFIDQALAHTFARVAIDPQKVALGGLSDGGMYALSVGVANGDLFTHLMAVSPGYMNPPGPPVGRPRIFLAHGTRDTVYSVYSSRERLLPQLRDAGYDVTYYEFDGPHFITPPAARAMLEWLVK